MHSLKDSDRVMSYETLRRNIILPNNKSDIFNISSVSASIKSDQAMSCLIEQINKQSDIDQLLDERVLLESSLLWPEPGNKPFSLTKT